VGQTRHEITQKLAARRCWELARREASRVARRVYRQQEVDGVYQLDAGAVLDAFFHVLQSLGAMALLEEVHGAAIRRERLPCVPYVLLYGVKPLFGIPRINALPRLLCSDEALMQLVGLNAQQVRQGLCQRGATTRQGERLPGPIGPDTLATTIVQWNVRDREAVFTGSIRALAKAGLFGKRGTGIAEGPELETTARDRGCGQATRKVRLADKHGQRPDLEVTGYGWKVLLLSEAVTKMPLAVQGGQRQEHEALWARALVTQARMKLAGEARLARVAFDKGFGDGPTRWGLAQQGLRFVVPANTNMAVTADARAQAAAGQDLTVGRRVHTRRPGQGKPAWPERVATAVVGMTALPTDDQYGPPAQGGQANRRAFQATPIKAVVACQWPGADDGPGGQTVFRTKAPGEKPVQVLDDDDDRSLIDNCWIKEAKPHWELGYPPQKNARAVRVPVVFTLLLCALAPAYRLQEEREAVGGEPVGWQRWRRQHLEQTRDQVIVLAAGHYGLFHLAAYSLLLGVKRKDIPPEIGSHQQVLAKYGLPVRG
jgi:hypothetical protein